MCPGWCNCNEQYKYLKAHFQGFEDMMKDPLARRSWNAAFNNQGWEERWALGTTLRKPLRGNEGYSQPSCPVSAVLSTGGHKLADAGAIQQGEQIVGEIKETSTIGWPADPPAPSVPCARHQYSWSLDLTSQNVRSRAGQGVEQRREALKSPRSRPSSSCKAAHVKTIPSNRAHVASTHVHKPMVYKQVAYGKVFLTWDLLGFFNSDVVVTIQGRRISVLASSQVVATVQVGRRAGLHYQLPSYDLFWQIHNVQHGMSCGRLRLAALMKVEGACDATHDSGQFEVSVGHEFKTCSFNVT
ncbi:hypothetical protein BDN71DRAFT_1433385 [Pleurotus eryngii]|uniref:Uncharacterized protein n=1 Tax=Pleurotus eryngii TaxID=5323 RepID=A0A9P5ZQ35_PLEER|nr:hypothetical protein BDN71DRAFT_1433385 [Pleurotus eryngii]